MSNFEQNEDGTIKLKRRTDAEAIAFLSMQLAAERAARQAAERQRDELRTAQLIRLWRFEDAPEEFRRLSDNGGDEDWVAHVPAAYSGYYVPWLDHGTRDADWFGCSSIDCYEQADRSKVYIGAHA